MVPEDTKPTAPHPSGLTFQQRVDRIFRASNEKLSQIAKAHRDKQQSPHISKGSSDDQ